MGLRPGKYGCLAAALLRQCGFQEVLLGTVILLAAQQALAGQNVRPSDRELAMKQGQVIEVFPLPHQHVHGPGDVPFTGSLTIRAGAGFRRTYTWDGATRKADLEPREERWYGNFGAYNANCEWRAHRGITRAVLSDGQMHFSSVDEAVKWLDQYDIVYSNSGMAVSFKRSRGGGGTLSVSVTQVMINGKKPLKLAGARDDLISIR